MDQDLKKYLDEMRVETKSTIDGSHKVLADSIRSTQSASLEQHEITRKQVSELNSRVSAMWKFIYGSDPPPPPAGVETPDISKIILAMPPVPSLPSDPPLDEQIPEFKKAIGQLRIDNAKMRSEITEVKELNKAQTKAMGIPPEKDARKSLRKAFDFVLWLFSQKEGQRYLLTAIAAFGTVSTLMGTCQGGTTSRSVSFEYPPPAHAAEASQERPTGHEDAGND